MATDNTTITTAIGANGTTYTASIANDRLTNNDFLKLMLEELKMQDPTKPMDSQNMLNMQMQMSSIETNLQLVSSIQAMQTAMNQSNLSNASSLINRIVENGEYGEDGKLKQFLVSSVALENGVVVLSANQITGYDTTNDKFILSTTKTDIEMNSLTSIAG